ncbi:Eukaryotic translation initiation factor 4E [Entamoeba marina]
MSVQSKNVDPLHMLTTGWTYWFDPGVNQVYSTSGVTANIVYNVHSVEEFWGLYDSLEKQTTLPKGIDSFFFRKDIEPKTTENGGKLLFNLELNDKDFIEDIWLKLLLACIGETFELRDKLNGVSFSLRSLGKFFIWVNTDTTEDLQKMIVYLRKFLNLPSNVDFRFFAHRGGSTIIKELS